MAKIEEQKPPIENDLPAVWDLVIQDMLGRDAVGIKTYKTRLQPHNGRNALKDAYFEILDLAVYLRQYIEEIEDHFNTYNSIRKLLQTYRIYLSYENGVYVIQVIDPKIQTVVIQTVGTLSEALVKAAEKIALI